MRLTTSPAPELVEMREKAEKWDEAMSRPDFLSQALNEGDGVYRL